MHSSDFLDAAGLVCDKIDATQIDALAKALSELTGCLFILGVGGSAANASHAVNDFRKLCGIGAYAPTDNIAEFTARTNDDGWRYTFSEFLKVTSFDSKDAILIFSVGGGTEESSPNIIEAIKLAKEVGAKVYGVVGKDSGYTAKHADICIVIPTVEEKWITPISESFQSVILHCLVSHPLLQKGKTKW